MSSKIITKYNARRVVISRQSEKATHQRYSGSAQNLQDGFKNLHRQWTLIMVCKLSGLTMIFPFIHDQAHRILTETLGRCSSQPDLISSSRIENTEASIFFHHDKDDFIYRSGSKTPTATAIKSSTIWHRYWTYEEIMAQWIESKWSLIWDKKKSY